MKLNKYDSCEGQVIKITKGGLNKPLIIANICRPPKDLNDKYRQFTNELMPILKSLDRKKAEVIITGDLIIDLLKINEKIVFSEFLDMITENSFYPKITFPTRFSNKHGTLIDNIFCKLTDMAINTISGILIKIFSDHHPYFTFLNNIFHKTSPPKLIKINNQYPNSISNFQNELTELNIMNQLDSSLTANPNDNYKILHNIIETAKNKHLPAKTVKHNKYKQKKLNVLLMAC